jgi:hypothetical protein
VKRRLRGSVLPEKEKRRLRASVLPEKEKRHLRVNVLLAKAKRHLRVSVRPGKEKRHLERHRLLAKAKRHQRESVLPAKAKRRRLRENAPLEKANDHLGRRLHLVTRLLTPTQGWPPGLETVRHKQLQSKPSRKPSMRVCHRQKPQLVLKKRLMNNSEDQAIRVWVPARR